MPTIIQSSPLNPILLLAIVLFLSHHSLSDAFFRPQNWSNVKTNTKRQQIQRTEVMMSDPLQSQHCQPCDSEEFPHNGNSDATTFSSTSSLFRHAIPSHRLGKRHDSLESYLDEIRQQKNQDEKDAPIEFSLVTILSTNDSNNQNEDGSSNISILLGKKMRGFGKGFYNCFGGKLEKTKNSNEHDHPAKGAVREICEETGISVPLTVMEDGFVGTLNFTFEDCDVNRAMKVYLFCVFVSLSKNDDKSDDSAQPQQQRGNAPVTIHPTQIRGCDEIEPEWFRNSHDIPLHQMFADDTVWLTTLLKYYDEKSNLQKHQTQQKLMFDAWFHFHSGGTETNSMMHQYIRINGNSTLTSKALPTPSTNAIKKSESDNSNIANNQISSAPHKYTVEQKLYHALHNNGISSPNIKEFKENWAMANSVRTFMKEQDRMKWVIDVAGGHGALGALFLALVPGCQTAVVIDPAIVKGKDGVQKAWSPFWETHANSLDSGNKAGFKKKELRYRHECLRTGLRDELDCILHKNQYAKKYGRSSSTPSSTNILVVACHACQHLTDETLQIASEYGVNVAVMPCCQKDHDGWWKGLTKRLIKSNGKYSSSLSIGAIMDLLAAGKMMAWNTGATAGVKYRVKMKLMDESISPLQNRMIICRAENRGNDGSGEEDTAKELAHQKLTRAYRRAHRVPKDTEREVATPAMTSKEITVGHYLAQTQSWFCIPSLLTGFSIGAAMSLFVVTFQIRNR